MYLTEVIVPPIWTKLENLIKQKIPGFAFDESKQYTIKNVSNLVNILELDEQPTDQIGFPVQTNEVPFVYKKTNGDLWARGLSFYSCLAIDEE